jgi:myo-inositol-1(or 4)-monophosphatase
MRADPEHVVSDVELAVTAALAGAQIVRSRFGKPLCQVAKEGGDFATSADIDAEQAITDVLQQARPTDAVHGEEGGLRGSGTRVWLVDPLCGTLNFAAQMQVVAVNVALRVGSDTTAAASADPFTGEVFWSGDGRARLRRDGRDERLQPSADSRLVDLNLDPPFPNGPVFRAARLLAEDEFGTTFRPRVVSSTLAVAWVAAGRRAAYLTDGDLRDSVHFASAIALCQAAGCVVTGLLGQPLHTGIGGLLVAADERTHSTLLDVVRRQFHAPKPPRHPL